ncbi:MAG: DUF2231 domain-containing protein [Oryzihumus sp.]
MNAALSTVADRVAGAVEEATFLDPVAGGLARLLSPLRRNQAAAGILGGEPLGHPAHPAVVLLPLGSWLSASILDVLGDERYQDAARTLTGAGLVLSLPAALTGANDWLPTRGPRQRVGLTHAATNVAALACFTAGWVARTRGNHRAGRRWGLAGSSMVGLSGWLGGHLAYNQGVGVRRATTHEGEAPSANEAPDLMDLVVEQHRALSTLMGTVADSRGAQRAEKFLQLRRDLAAHEAAEAAVVHPLTRQDLPGGESIATAREDEEAKASAALTELEQFDPDSDEFEERFARLRRDVEAHAEHEETEELARLRRDRGRENLVPVGEVFRTAQAAALRQLAEDQIASFLAMVEVARDAVWSAL